MLWVGTYLEVIGCFFVQGAGPGLVCIRLSVFEPCSSVNPWGSTGKKYEASCQKLRESGIWGRGESQRPMHRLSSDRSPWSTVSGIYGGAPISANFQPGETWPLALKLSNPLGVRETLAIGTHPNPEAHHARGMSTKSVGSKRVSGLESVRGLRNQR